MTIKFQFDIRKTIEATAFLINLNGGKINYMSLLKMLYIADRRALDCMDSPITGDIYYSLDYGPVLSGVYDLIKGKEPKFLEAPKALEVWQTFITPRTTDYKIRSNYEISLVKDPGTGELCPKDEEILSGVYDEFGHLNPFTVAEWTHGLPEWRNPHGSTIPIQVDHVLMYLQKTSEQIEEIRLECEAEDYIRRVINEV